MSQVFSEDRADWLKSYCNQVQVAYRTIFDGAGARFPDGSRLLCRFQQQIDAVARGQESFSALNETQNELSVAAAALATANVMHLAYEPPLPNTPKTIDFRATLDHGVTSYIDVKTIRPEPLDRWSQFERAQEEGWLTGIIDFDRQWLGGEMWHNMFAARSSMLQYTIQLEEKIRDASLPSQSITFTLVFCGSGFEWEPHQLYDFAVFYSSGKHSAYDQLAPAETHHLAEKAITLDRTISQFGYLLRANGSVYPAMFGWDILNNPAHY